MKKSLDQVRRRAGATMVDGFFRGASRLGKLHPLASPDRHGVEVVRDIAYEEQSDRHEHRLDVYRPKDRQGLLPVVLYIHGGGFRILSKDTHWIMALAFARRGFVVFNVGYRLAPDHPFPTAVEDVARAFDWVRHNAERWGGDLDRLVIAGESAGANLALGTALSTVYEREEHFARRAFEAGIVPKVVLPACGIFQVTDPERFVRRKPHFPRFLADRLEEVHNAYLGPDYERHGPTLDFADPLPWLERGEAPDRALPPFFLPVGTRDPLLDDTRRVARALRSLGATAEDRYYVGEVHAFHAFVMRKNARRCWVHTFEFLDRHLPSGEGAQVASSSSIRD
jgi:acetyl esterase